MSLLPAYMDELWHCYEQMHREDLHSLDLQLLSVDPLTCHVKVLPFLAWEADVNISVLDEVTARAVIKSAFDAMVYAGTVKSLSHQMTSLMDNTKVIEWFKYDGKPYHFKVEITASNMKKRFSAELFEKAKNSVSKYKNVRSVFDEFSMKLADADERIEVAEVSVMNVKLKSDFKQDDKQITLNLNGGGVMNVKISNDAELVYPQAEINIQGAGTWEV